MGRLAAGLWQAGGRLVAGWQAFYPVCLLFCWCLGIKPAEDPVRVCVCVRALLCSGGLLDLLHYSPCSFDTRGIQELLKWREKCGKIKLHTKGKYYEHYVCVLTWCYSGTLSGVLDCFFVLIYHLRQRNLWKWENKWQDDINDINDEINDIVTRENATNVMFVFLLYVIQGHCLAY